MALDRSINCCMASVSVRAGIRAIPLPCDAIRSYQSPFELNGGFSHTAPRQSACRPLSSFVRCRLAGTLDGGAPGLQGSKSNSTPSAVNIHDGAHHSSVPLLTPAVSHIGSDGPR